MPFYQIAQLARQLTRDEGVRLKPYKDSVGKTTIGIGRNLDDVGISAEEAQTLLDNDIARSAADVEKFLPWATTLDPARWGALINAAFNMGIGGLLQFKHALEALRNGDYEQAATEFLDSKWAQQVGPRAVRLAQQIRSGDWQ